MRPSDVTSSQGVTSGESPVPTSVPLVTADNCFGGKRVSMPPQLPPLDNPQDITDFIRTLSGVDQQAASKFLEAVQNLQQSGVELTSDAQWADLLQGLSTSQTSGAVRQLTGTAQVESSDDKNKLLGAAKEAAKALEDMLSEAKFKDIKQTLSQIDETTVGKAPVETLDEAFTSTPLTASISTGPMRVNMMSLNKTPEVEDSAAKDKLLGAAKDAMTALGDMLSTIELVQGKKTPEGGGSDVQDKLLDTAKDKASDLQKMLSKLQLPPEGEDTAAKDKLLGAAKNTMTALEKMLSELDLIQGKKTPEEEDTADKDKLLGAAKDAMAALGKMLSEVLASQEKSPTGVTEPLYDTPSNIPLEPLYATPSNIPVPSTPAGPESVQAANKISEIAQVAKTAFPPAVQEAPKKFMERLKIWWAEATPKQKAKVIATGIGVTLAVGALLTAGIGLTTLTLGTFVIVLPFFFIAAIPVGAFAAKMVSNKLTREEKALQLSKNIDNALDILKDKDLLPVSPGMSPEASRTQLHQQLMKQLRKVPESEQADKFIEIMQTLNQQAQSAQ